MSRTPGGQTWNYHLLLPKILKGCFLTKLDFLIKPKRWKTTFLLFLGPKIPKIHFFARSIGDLCKIRLYIKNIDPLEENYILSLLGYGQYPRL